MGWEYVYIYIYNMYIVYIYEYMVFIALKVAMLIDHVCVNYTELYIYDVWCLFE